MVHRLAIKGMLSYAPSTFAQTVDVFTATGVLTMFREIRCRVPQMLALLQLTGCYDDRRRGSVGRLVERWFGGKVRLGQIRRRLKPILARQSLNLEITHQKVKCDTGFYF
ncbi:MAG: hypothetical protein JXA33_17780 [Anaerolineae bacterium]|nr:hypothetical protein [Anaerolineae bacterium]